MGNKNSYNNTGFVQVGYPHNGCSDDCDNNDVAAATSYNTGCGCDNDNGYSSYHNGRNCGCDNDRCGCC